MLGLLIAALAVTALARRLNWSAPLLLVAVGMVVSFLPGVPPFELHPELVLTVVLPPLLYSAALDSSYLSLKAAVRPIVGLGVVLVVVTAFAVGYVVHLLMPGLPFAAALALGAVVAPPDAVTAAAIGRQLGLPRGLMTVLSGESLVNDAAALTVYKVAVAAVVGAGGSFARGVGVFGLATVVGIALGLVLGWAAHAVRMRLGDTSLESVFGLTVPFAAYLIAEELHGSGVLAVVAAGLVLGHLSPRASFATRLQAQTVWNTVNLLLETVVFALIGLQLRTVLDGLNASGVALNTVVGKALLVLLAVIVIRVVAVFVLGMLPRVPLIPQRRDRPSWRALLVISWTGMRGVVTLAAAAAIPLTTDSGAPFPGRETIALVAFVVTVGTLLVQGLTLPWLIRRLDVRDPGERGRDAEAEANAREAATAAAMARFDELVAPAAVQLPPEVAAKLSERLRAMERMRAKVAARRLEQTDDEDADGRAGAFTRLRRELLSTQREALVAERDAGRLDDEVMRRVLRELDLEEAALTSSWRSRL
ncbi:Na+/H+ antiporter [Solihabitans fulvus]|uniref:Na+/H+ antiporter n=1 Tax=Solihabitans fulvus TaxID=1892852 RepID=A0A5B2X9J0_9PSEU|nr:Na+/H+ antiporter [Solihabitans fulvus]